MRILFQGDSVTDADRDRRDFHHMGNGYAKYASELIRDAHPEIEFEFINLGLSGNRTGQLFDRLYADAISLKPDIVSILIGINDVWARHVYPFYVMTTNEQIEANFRAILKELRAKTDAKIMVIAPYILDCDDKDEMKEELKSVMPIIRGLSEEYADLYLPLDELFAKAIENAPEKLYYSKDGVHLNPIGAQFVAEQYAKAIEKLL